MKISLLVVNLVVTASCIFAYDQLKAPPSSSAADNDVGSLLGSDTDEPAPPSAHRPEPMRSGGLQDRSRAALESRIAALERLVSTLQAQRPSTHSQDPSPSATGTHALPELSASDLVDPEDPSYDEATLKTIASYMDEINRRKQIERQRTRIAADLERLGIELTDDQSQSVVKETLRFQGKARDLLRQGWPRDEEGRNARRKAFEGLQEEYRTTLNRLVPTADAEKISQSRIARGLGFFSGRNGRFNSRQRSGVGAKGKKKRRNPDR